MEKTVHKNLNTGTWIVCALSGKSGKGLKERDVSEIWLRNVRFNVQNAAATKIMSGAHRSVHAWSIGTPIEAPAGLEGGVEIAYNPKRGRIDFHTRADGRTVISCEILHFRADGVVMAHGHITLA